MSAQSRAPLALRHTNQFKRSVGRYRGIRESHIEPDWLLTYRINEDRLVLIAINTGTHDSLGLE